MEEQQFLVIVTNEILGNSEKRMTMEEIENYNLVAFTLAQQVEIDGEKRSSGMWTVKPVVA